MGWFDDNHPMGSAAQDRIDALLGINSDCPEHIDPFTGHIKFGYRKCSSCKQYGKKAKFSAAEYAKTAATRVCKSCPHSSSAGQSSKRAREEPPDAASPKDFSGVECIVEGPTGSGNHVKYRVHWFGPDTEAALRALKGPELKLKASAAGVPVSGTKDTLVSRILEKETSWELASDLPSTMVAARVAVRAREQAESRALLAEKRAAGVAPAVQAPQVSSEVVAVASDEDEDAAVSTLVDDARPAKAARVASSCSYCHGLRPERHASKIGCPLRKEDMRSVGFTKATEAEVYRYDLGARDAKATAAHEKRAAMLEKKAAATAAAEAAGLIGDGDSGGTSRGRRAPPLAAASPRLSTAEFEAARAREARAEAECAAAAATAAEVAEADAVATRRAGTEAAAVARQAERARLQQREKERRETEERARAQAQQAAAAREAERDRIRREQQVAEHARQMKAAAERAARVKEEAAQRAAAAERERDAQQQRDADKPTCKKHWISLSPEQQAMAGRLGWSKHSWVANQWHNIRTKYEHLSQSARADAEALGFTPANWHGTPSTTPKAAPPKVAPPKAGASVCCPWPQCKNRAFKAAKDHQNHCDAKHGGKRAPPGWSGAPPLAPPSSALPRHKFSSAALAATTRVDGASLAPAAASSSGVEDDVVECTGGRSREDRDAELRQHAVEVDAD